jgi:hypothetical protein
MSRHPPLRVPIAHPSKIARTPLGERLCTIPALPPSRLSLSRSTTPLVSPPATEPVRPVIVKCQETVGWLPHNDAPGASSTDLRLLPARFP